jgi:hypothetical protein
MTGTVPQHPKIYHIVHVDRLPSIIQDGYLWCDAEIVRRRRPGSSIGMNCIKQRRLNQLELESHPGLKVGACVPFYFCPRSVMLYLISQANHPELAYRGGQTPIVHLEADLRLVVAWARRNNKRWAFTLSNAGASYFEDRCSLDDLGEIDWDAVRANRWAGNGVSSTIKEGKQAEFLMENCFPWALVERIGVISQQYYDIVGTCIGQAGHRPHRQILAEWYY